MPCLGTMDARAPDARAITVGSLHNQNNSQKGDSKMVSGKSLKYQDLRITTIVAQRIVKDISGNYSDYIDLDALEQFLNSLHDLGDPRVDEVMWAMLPERTQAHLKGHIKAHTDMLRILRLRPQSIDFSLADSYLLPAEASSDDD